MQFAQRQCTGGLKNMSDNTLFGTTIDLATRALELRSRKHEMILSNIANADTPGYKALIYSSMMH